MTATNQLSEHEPLYTVGVVAERLGIPRATLRSWNRRYGIGPLDHRHGAHRLYTENDVAVLRRMQRLIGKGVGAGKAARAAAGAETARRSDAAALLSAAFALDADAVGRVIDECLRARGVVDTWDELLGRHSRRCRLLQIEGGGCIDVEHLLTRETMRALQRLPAPSRPSPAGVILACCDGEVHTLALEALAAALVQCGRIPLMLGGSAPVEGVLAALAKRPDVDVVVLWSQLAATADLGAVRSITSAGVAGPGGRPRLGSPAAQGCRPVVQPECCARTTGTAQVIWLHRFRIVYQGLVWVDDGCGPDGARGVAR